MLECLNQDNIPEVTFLVNKFELQFNKADENIELTN